jgi:hypothetical protein
MDNVNKLYGTKWTNEHTWMQSGLQKNPYRNIWTMLKTLWNPIQVRISLGDTIKSHHTLIS